MQAVYVTSDRSPQKPSVALVDFVLEHLKVTFTETVWKVVNGILYLLRTGCSWQTPTHEFPPWGTTRYYYRRFRPDGTWERVHDRLREQVRCKVGKKPTPSTGIVDSHSIKTDASRKKSPRLRRGQDGFDSVYAKTLGRKRYLIVDTLGLVVALAVHAGGLRDPNGAEIVLSEIAGRFGRPKTLWADSGHSGELVHVAKRWYGRTLEIVRRTDKHKFKVLPKRWIAERTFSWLGKYRRLSKDYVSDPRSSEAMIRLAMVNSMIHRLQPG